MTLRFLVLFAFSLFLVKMSLRFILLFVLNVLVHEFLQKTYLELCK